MQPGSGAHGKAVALEIRRWFADRGGLAAVVACAAAVAAAGVAATGPVAVPQQLLAAAPLLISLIALLVAWRTSTYFDLPRERRYAWRLVSLALLGVLATGAAVQAFSALAGTVTRLSTWTLPAADLIFHAVLAGGIGVLVHSCRDGAPRARFWLDAMAVVLSFGALLWLFVLAPLVEQVGPGAALRPTLDAVLLMLAALLLIRRAGRLRSAAGAWVALATGLLLVGDLHAAWNAGKAQALTGVTHGVCYALLAVAAQADYLGASRIDRRSGLRPWSWGDAGILPFAGLLMAMGILVYDRAPAWREPGVLLLFVVCAAGLLLIGRQLLATREVARFEANAARTAAEARFSSLVRNSSDAIAIAAEDGRLFYVTPSAERVFGLRPEELVGRRMTELVALEDRARLQELFSTSLAQAGASATLELRVPRGKDRHRIIEMVATNLLTEPSVAGCVLNIRDVTDRKGLEDQLRRLAFHDPLTLLANRALFRDRVEHALAVSRRRGNRVAAIFVDLDNFKKINDSMGHGEGDRVLRATAQRLSKCTRNGDTVARLGGDEFAILTEDAAHADDVIEVAARIVEALKEPFPFAGSSLRVAASVGVAFADEADGVEELLRNADVAMYHAKEQGKSRYAVFQPEMQREVQDRLRIEADLTRAIHRNELRLLYQPIVDLGSGYLLGVEALVRWQHPERGLIPPAEFIEVAEETGQVVGLGRWVLHEACREVREWQRRMPLGKQLRVAVNVSGQQLQGGDLVAEVTGALEHTGLDAGALVIEMTESVVMQNTEETFAKLSRLKRLGVRIAIDDFGTGYSSLSYLHRFPIDILKIDRSFVQRLGEERDGTELARAIITLGETLGLEVVAEGIEYEHQLRELVELGCVAGQGYYYSRPALLREIEYSHHAKLRKAFVRSLPPEAGTSATGRFKRPEIPDDLGIDLGTVAGLGR